MRKDSGSMTIQSEKSERIRIECNPYFLDNALDWLNRQEYTVNGYGPKYLGDEQYDNAVILITAYKIIRIPETVICANAFMPCSCPKCGGM